MPFFPLFFSTELLKKTCVWAQEWRRHADFQILEEFEWISNRTQLHTAVILLQLRLLYCASGYHALIKRYGVDMFASGAVSLDCKMKKIVFSINFGTLYFWPC